MEIDSDKLRVAGYVVAAIVALVLGVQLLGGGGGNGGAGVPVTVDPAPASGAARGTPAASPAAGRPPPSARVAVQVAGEVRRPGVYMVPAAARAVEAVQLAGGLTAHADQAGVNLVARVRDGQQVIVPRKGAAGAAGGTGAATSGSGSAGAAPSAPVSLSSATVQELDALDGIGPTLAQRILAYRQAHGGFRSIDELRQVQGIGEKRMAALRKAVTP